MTHEAAQAIVRRYRNVSDAELSNADINLLHREITTELIPLESELTSLRQIVADVETCQQGRQLMVEGDRNRDFKHAKVGVLHDGCYKRFDAETWQAALHAAAEWVRAGGER